MIKYKYIQSRTISFPRLPLFMTIEFHSTIMSSNSNVLPAAAEQSLNNASGAGSNNNSMSNMSNNNSTNVIKSLSKDSHSNAGYNILFDEVGKIRVLDPAMFDSSEKLKEECQDFLSSKFSNCHKSLFKQ